MVRVPDRSVDSILKIVDRFERTFGRNAYAHLFVTQAMKDHLTKEWDLMYA
jgi:beta-1,4-mannosyltransferase